MRFTVLAMVVFVGACAAEPTDTGTGDDDDGGGGATTGGGGGGSNTSSGSGTTTGSGTTSGSGASTGSGSTTTTLPAEIIGSWWHTESDAGISYDFTAQGAVAYVGELTSSSGSCTFGVLTEYNGTVTYAGGLLTLTPTDGEQQVDNCGIEHDSTYSKVEVDAYQVDGSTLSLQNQATGTTLTLSKH